LQDQIAQPENLFIGNQTGQFGAQDGMINGWEKLPDIAL
jgi:hypothetical protein